MKTPLKSLLGICLCIALLSSCEKDKKENLQGSLAFKFQTKDVSDLKSSKAEPIATAIVVSIEKNGGGVAYDKEKLTLSYLNGSYLSKELALPEGNYNLTEFLVTDANNQIIYATPKQGSVLAQLVNKPLPLSFNSSSNTETILAPDVIRTDTSSLEDLGYTGFSFNVVKSIKFLMTVLSNSNSPTNFETIDSCNLSVTSSSGKILNFTLKAGINPIYVTDDTGKYILNIQRKGFKPWADTLSESQLKNYSTTPLQAILAPVDPSIWFLSKKDIYRFNYVGPTITARSVANFYVDWGDGTTQNITASSYSFLKDLDMDGERLLQISNNLGEIKSVGFFGWKDNHTDFISVNLSNAKAVEEFSAYFTNIRSLSMEKSSLKRIYIWLSGVPLTFADYPNLETIAFRPGGGGTIDLRTNNKLKSLSTVGGLRVLFGSNPALTSVTLYDDLYSPVLTEDDVNSCLIGLLASVQSSPRAGSFVVSYNGSHAVFPSGEGRQAAITLRDQYAWILYVNDVNGMSKKMISL